MGMFRRTSSDQPDRRSNQDEGDDFLGQFLASNPQPLPPTPPPPTRSPSPPSASVAPANGGISLADLLPDLFGANAQMSSGFGTAQPPVVPPPFPTDSPSPYAQPGIVPPPPTQPAPIQEVIAPQISAKEQKKREKAMQKAQKAREKELSDAQKAQERQVRQAQKEQEQAQKGQEISARQSKKTQEEQADLARLGLIAADGEELTSEQQIKLEAFRNLKKGGGGNKNTPILIAVGVTLVVIAFSLVLAFFIIPPEISLGDMKAPDKSVRYEVKPSVIDQIKREVVALKAYDEKKAKRVQVEMLAVTNPGNQAQILDYYNNSMKEKGYPNGELLDSGLASALSPRRLGTGGRPMFWPKKESQERSLVIVISLANNPGNLAAANDIIIQQSETPLTPNGSFVMMIKFNLPPD